MFFVHREKLLCHRIPLTTWRMRTPLKITRFFISQTDVNKIDRVELCQESCVPVRFQHKKVLVPECASKAGRVRR